MNKKLESVAKEWNQIKTSSWFHNILMFLIFIAIAAVFWLVVAINDDITETFEVKINIQNVPDSVTFINDPPSDMHVTFRDKGTNILRTGVIKHPTVNIDFREYARNGVLRLSNADISAELKKGLGGMALISSFSIDSIRSYYTTEPGKRVPVVVQSNVTAASGYIISGTPVPETKTVLIYSVHEENDTISHVLTQRLQKKDLSQSTVFDVNLLPIPNVKIVPSAVKIKVNVESLVHKEAYISIDPLNVPQGQKLLLFPSSVPVSFFVPMSKFNDENPNIHVVIDYNDIKSGPTDMLPVRISASSSDYVNVTLKTDSVEYTLIR